MWPLRLEDPAERLKSLASELPALRPRPDHPHDPSAQALFRRVGLFSFVLQGPTDPIAITLLTPRGYAGVRRRLVCRLFGSAQSFLPRRRDAQLRDLRRRVQGLERKLCATTWASPTPRGASPRAFS